MKNHVRPPRLSLINPLSLMISLFLMILLALVPAQALAHKAVLYAHAAKGRVFAEGVLSNGGKCKGCSIKVFDASTGALLHETRTNRDGSASFVIANITAKAAPLMLKLSDGMGHAAEAHINEVEIIASLNNATPYDVLNENTGCIPEQVARALIDNAVAKETTLLESEVRKLREDSEKPRVTEIIGGIGFILGLMGLALYFRKPAIK